MHKRLVMIGLLGATLSPALADFSTVNPSVIPTELNTRQILEGIYGGTWSGADWGALSYTNGTITATRVDDFLPGGGPGDALLTCGGEPGLPTTDQVWEDGFTTAVAQARYAFFAQKFGYFDGAAGGTYTNLFDVTGDGFAVAGDATIASALLGTTFRWGRDGDNGPHSSLDADNPGGVNHLVTYRIDGLGNGYTTWLLFWEDKNPGDPAADFDYNDLVVEVKCIPAPGAALLGALGLGLVGLRRRLAS